MDLVANLALGFSTALSIQNLIYAFIGCVLGTLSACCRGSAPSPPSPCCCRPPMRYRRWPR